MEKNRKEHAHVYSNCDKYQKVNGKKFSIYQQLFRSIRALLCLCYFRSFLFILRDVEMQQAQLYFATRINNNMKSTTRLQWVRITHMWKRYI